MSAALVRPAERRDLPDLVRIYNHYVLRTHITFDTRELSVAQRIPWFQDFADSGPHRLLVAESADRPVGYASSRAFRPKPAYARSVETTVYLDPDEVGRGIGRCLYERLLGVLRVEPSVHRAYAGIALPNPRSIALHARLGFSPVGTFHEAGFKFDQYCDVSWYEMDLSNPDPA